MSLLLKDGMDQIKNKIKSLRQETYYELTDKRNVTNDPMEDKLTRFRQQSSHGLHHVIHYLFTHIQPNSSRNEENTAECLNDMHGEAVQLGEEVVV